MELPFSRAKFLDAFAAYNRALAPWAAVLWLGSLTVVLIFLRRHRLDRAVSLLLAVLWAWSGVAYHAAFFARINPAARIFAALFVIQGVLFSWLAFRPEPLRYHWEPGLRGSVGLALAAYGLAYPGLALLAGEPWPRIPSFGVPCPTTILTAGLLLAADPLPAWLAVIPILWGIIGGSAAFLLGIPTDYALFFAAGILAVAAVRRRHAGTSSA